MGGSPTNAYRTRSLSETVEDSGSREDGVATTVTYIGHATFLIGSGGETIITDPILSDRVGRYFTKRSSPCPIRPEAIQGIIGILISHGHHDHLDYPSLQRLGRTHPIVVPWGIAPLLRVRGFSDVRVSRPWEELSLGGWRITPVPSRHFGGRLPLAFTTGYQGYVLSGPSCIYFAGDSGFDEPMFLEIGRRFSIDLAILPIAGALFPGFRRNHMNSEEALRAFQVLGAKRMIPMHFETFPASFGPADEARRHLHEESARLGTDDLLSVLSPGESLNLESGGGLGGEGLAVKHPITDSEPASTASPRQLE